MRFRKSAEVAVREDHPDLGLRAGDSGIVWALYDTNPPAYEVAFRDADGVEFDFLMEQDELTETPKR